MKKQSIFHRIFVTALFAVCTLCLALFAGCNDGGVEQVPSTQTQFSFQENTVWLDRYQEKIPELASGNIEDITFISNNEKVVTVSGKTLVATGVGETTVTAKNKDYEQTLTVKVNDSGVLPRLYYESGKGLEAYLGASEPLKISIRYLGEVIVPDQTYDSVTVSDASYATFENGKITGVKLGQTTANVSVNYKGLQLSLRDVKLTVKEQCYIENDVSTIELYNVTSGKLGFSKLEPQVYYRGGLLENAPVSYEILSGSEFIKIENATVYPKGVGNAVIQAKYAENGRFAQTEWNVTVHPNYKNDEFVVPVGDGDGSIGAYYQPYEGEIAEGREGVMAYRAGSEVTSATTWQHRVALLLEGTPRIIDKVREGDKYFAFDVYYTSDMNLYCGCYNQTFWLKPESYFRRNTFKILNMEGEAINYLPKNQWVTCVYDLRAYFDYAIKSQYSFWFLNADTENTCYIDNIRWYLDDSFMKSENLVYEDKGNYVQATNDEFDVRYPNVNGAPTYTQGGGAGRNGAYRYEAKSASATTNSLVIASSINESYDYGMYALRKKGATLSFDMYVENAETLTLQMFTNNNPALQNKATIQLGTSNLSPYFGWLKIVKDGKVCSNLQSDTWYTVYIAYLKNYDYNCSSAEILLSTDSAGDQVYLDNVRYYKDDVVFTEYEPELNHPYTTGAPQIQWDISLTEFDFAYYSVTTTSNDNNGVNFTNIVAENGNLGSFFASPYRYLKMKIYVVDGTQFIRVNVSGEGLQTYTKEIFVGQNLPEGITVLDESKFTATAFYSGTWYTIYIPVTVQGEVTAPDVTMEMHGGTVAEPSCVYLAEMEAVSEIHTPYVNATQFNVGVNYQASGEFAGSYKVTSDAPGDVAMSDDYGRSMIRFDGMSQVISNKDYAGRFFYDGNKYISLKIYFDEKVKGFSIRSTDQKHTNKEQGGITSYWKQNIMVGASIPGDVYLYYNGVKAPKLETGVWYELFIPVNYEDASKVLFPYVGVYTTQNEAGNPSSVYVKNVEYVKEMPKPKPSVFLFSTHAESKTSTLEYKTSGTFVGAYEHIQTVDGDSSAGGYGFNGMWFYGLSKYENFSFFKDGNNTVKFKVYFAENVKSFSLRFVGDNNCTTSYWKQRIELGNIPSDVYVYDETGATRVTSAEMGKWYTIVVKINGIDLEAVYANNVSACFYVNREDTTKNSKVYLKDIEYYAQA